MRNRLSIVLALLASSILMGVGLISFKEGTASSKPVILLQDMFWCDSDDDCVAVEKIGCCPCRQGGAQAAITRWHRDDLRRFLKGACRNSDPVCVQIDLCRFDMHPMCIDRQCKLVPKHA